MSQARSILEGAGIPVTVSLLEVSATAVEDFDRRRSADSHVTDKQLAREIAARIVTTIGQRQAIQIVADNDRLSAWRKATGSERPTNPSVQDLCQEIVDAQIQNVLVTYANNAQVRV